MFFPWVGIFEQIRLADIYVHYDDVQLPQGRSFMSRVQIKTKDGIKWLTVPLKRGVSGPLIKDSYITYEERWVDNHLKFLKSNFQKSPFCDEMTDLVESIYSLKFETISQLNSYAIEVISKYFRLGEKIQFFTSSALELKSTSSQHLLDIVKIYKGDNYITGWGAKNYLDYSLFEKENIDVQYMDYEKKEYSQLYGDFTPFVSILDLIANTGQSGEQFIVSKSKTSKTFIP